MSREQVLAYARAQLGKPYVFNTAGPDTFDCSGLTLRAYQFAGIKPVMAHYTVTQYETLAHAAIGAALPGDLLFFGGYNPGAALPHHVGIYVSPGVMIDAPTEGVPVGYHDYNSYGDVMNTVGVYPGGESPAGSIATKIGDDEMFIRFINGGPRNDENAVYQYSGGVLLYQSKSQYEALGSPHVSPINVQGGHASLWFCPVVKGTPDRRKV